MYTVGIEFCRFVLHTAPQIGKIVRHTHFSVFCHAFLVATALIYCVTLFLSRNLLISNTNFRVFKYKALLIPIVCPLLFSHKLNRTRYAAAPSAAARAASHTHGITHARHHTQHHTQQHTQHHAQHHTQQQRAAKPKGF